MGSEPSKATFCSYEYSMSLMLCLPLIPYAITFLLTGTAFIWVKLIGKPDIVGVSTGWMCTNMIEVRAYFLGLLSASVPFMHIVYNGICVKIFNTFMCTTFRDGVEYLDVAPDIVCWTSSTHHAMLAAAVCGIIVYVVGIPAYVFFTLTYGQRNDKFKDPEWLQVLGFLYVRYGMCACLHARHVPLGPLHLGSISAVAVHALRFVGLPFGGKWGCCWVVLLQSRHSTFGSSPSCCAASHSAY